MSNSIHFGLFRSFSVQVSLFREVLASLGMLGWVGVGSGWGGSVREKNITIVLHRTILEVLSLGLLHSSYVVNGASRNYTWKAYCLCVMEDKRATTDVQHRFVLLFYYLSRLLFSLSSNPLF